MKVLSSKYFMFHAAEHILNRVIAKPPSYPIMLIYNRTPKFGNYGLVRPYILKDTYMSTGKSTYNEAIIVMNDPLRNHSFSYSFLFRHTDSKFRTHNNFIKGN